MTTPAQKPKAYRLPAYALPSRYDIQIDARLGRDTFYGKVKIQLDIKEANDTIELHQYNLQLSNATLTANGKALEGDVKADNEREMAAIRFKEPMPTGQATLEIDFNGHLSPSLEGLYLAKDGPEECLCTQCEATGARRIFPCFDEPDLKARFAWQVTTDDGATVLANGPVQTVSEVGDGKSKLWEFEPTKPMSSYLVALIIGPMQSTQEEIVKGTPMKVWALRGKEQMGQFAETYTTHLFPWYEQYFDAPYHFDKYDQAAVPGFAAGAMENSGLVIYRQSALIMDPRTASWQAERRIAQVIAHETAHMWFGDLVTMKWWDDLWLNEAFAEWVSSKAVSILSPDYETWNDFQAGKNAAMTADALESTHPIYTPVQTPAEAAEIFDLITYQKGSSVLRMLENFLGEDDFRAGIRTYMKEFAESNATGADLWRHLQAASDRPVQGIMESWIMQPGYPVVSVSVEGNGGSTQLQLSQQRFFSAPNMSNGQHQTWHVPLVVRYEDNTGVHEARHLLDSAQMSLPIEVNGELKWCYANADEIGFYRQNPDEAVLTGLLANLDKLLPTERSGLLSDQWALVRNGTHSMSRFLDVLSALSSARDYSVLGNVVGRLHAIETMLEGIGDQEALQKFRVWVNNAFQGQLAELGYEPKEGESQNDIQRRVSLIDALATLAENPDAIEQAEQKADQEAANPASVDPNLAGLFVSAAAQYGDSDRFDKYVKIYEQRQASGSSPQERNRYLNSFVEFRPPELVSRTLGLMDQGVIAQEAIGPVLRQMLPMPHAQLQAWDYMKAHWRELNDKLGDQWISGLVKGTGQLPANKRDDLASFYDKNLNGVAEMSYAQALETLDQLAEFKERTKSDLVGWFKKQ